MRSQFNQTRWIPQGSSEIPHRLGVVYVYPVQDRFAVIAYSGRANKAAFNEVYRTEEQRQDRIDKWFRGLELSEASKIERRTERNKAHTLKPGDILHHSWGWEQTNCDYYQVISVKDHFAFIQEICSETVEDSQGYMSDYRKAVPNSFVKDSEPFRVKINGYNSVSASKGPLSHGSCRLWNGEKNYCSWYA